jgi:hypothetical protein
LRRRIATFRANHTVPRTIEAILAETEREMDVVERYADEFGYVFYLLQLDENAEIDVDEDEDEPVSTQRSSIREPELLVKNQPPTGAGVGSRRGHLNAASTPPLSRRSLIETLNVPVDWEARVQLERKFTQIVAELGLYRAEELLNTIRSRVEASIDKS